MAPPDFLNSSVYPFAYQQDLALTDVTSVISTVRSLLVTTLGWTEPSTALFKSPPDAGGKFIDILLTRISATNLEFRVRDYRAQSYGTRRIQFDATMNVNYFCSTMGLVIESLRSTAEIALGFLLEPSPDSVTEVDHRVVMNGYRSTADTQDNTGSTAGMYYGWEGFISGRHPQYSNLSATNFSRKTAAGTFLYTDPVVYATVVVAQWIGRVCHAVLCDSTIAPGTDKTVPIDNATTGVFRSVGYTANTSYNIMFRKS